MAAFAKNLFRWIGGGSKPETPALPAPIAPPQPDQAAEIANAARRQRRLLAPSSARSTLLTGPSGIDSPAPTERRTILGG